ncbi:hypothetical protein HYS31_03305, partial [Candidatus Woesearchaeota archaeon]|nr:hypothetical protein [Candidatus Woesearchaeota archaeon]
IKISPECTYLGVTELPDYYTGYKVSGVGIYSMNLTAVTANGVRSVQDNFTVQSTVDFDVARKGPTRVYPAVAYTMKIPIIANQNYNGIINEYVPSSFTITPQDGLGITSSGDTSILSWNVNLKKDDKIELSYKFDAPDISPEFYVLGPLEIGAFKEARQWQIANDVLLETDYFVIYKDSSGNINILESQLTQTLDELLQLISPSSSSTNAFYINKSGVLFGRDISSPWLKLLPEIRIKKGANWFNFTLLELNLSKITIIDNNTQEAILRFDYNKTVGGAKAYFKELFIFDSSNNYVLINFSMNITVNIDDSYFKLNLQEIKINNTEDNDFATFVTAGGKKRYVNLSNPDLDVTRKKSRVKNPYFELVDEDTGKYAWVFYNKKDIGVNETYHVKGGSYPNALIELATQGSSLNAGVYTISWAWNDPVLRL